jgi:hypothetical protein
MASRISRGGAAILICLALPTAALAATFTVTNTDDSGAGSLRQAILDANGNPGLDTISFAIPGAGVRTITLASGLDPITDPVVLDGYTQPGSSPNTLAVGDDAVILVRIDAGASNPALVLDFGSDGSTVRGLAIVQAPTGGEMVKIRSNGDHVAGNFIGVDTDGQTLAGTSDAIVSEGPSGTAVGSTLPADRNVVATTNGELIRADGNGTIIQGNYLGLVAAGTAGLGTAARAINIEYGNGVSVGGPATGAGNVIGTWTIRAIQVGEAGAYTTSDVTIQNNLIGTDAAGTAGLSGGSPDAVSIGRASAVTILGNVITNRAGIGIDVVGSSSGASGVTIQGNKIGTDVTGTLPIPNGQCGIHITNTWGVAASGTIGGRDPGEGNIIAFSGSNGIGITGAVGPWTIVGNSMFGNARLGITLGGNCGDASASPTPNDPGDADTGPNGVQNFPIVQAVNHLGPQLSGSTEIVGKLDSTPSTDFTLDFYADTACSNFPREFLQGRTYLGSAPVTTDGSGHAGFDVTLPVLTENGARISATATDPSGNTSEISQRILFSVSPTSGDSAGGSGITVSGTDFADPTTLTFGGVPAPVVFVDDHTLNATSPALSPGTANDLVATTPDGTTGILVKGWVADFLDVPSGQQFYFYVTKLVSNAITAGIGGGLYGVNDNTLRQQMAVFLLKAKHGLCYTPPPCTGVFTDVPCPSTFANWIEALAAEGITGGCGGTSYCPQNPVRRDQMAVFLLKAEHGSGYTPPACTGVFLDVACPSTFAAWIEQLAAESITGGCGNGNYCPSNPNTRGQMAVFISKTFNLQ